MKTHTKLRPLVPLDSRHGRLLEPLCICDEFKISGFENSTHPLVFRVHQAAGQVKMLIFLVKIIIFPMYTTIFCDAGQVPILRYFET